MPSRCSGAKLRHQMTLARITTPRLVDKSGVSESTIRRILSDKSINTSDTVLQLIADALQCSPFDLLRDDAIDQVVRTDAEVAVSETVAEAVMEAVTVVTNDVAPDATPEQIAQAVPDLQVTPPPALDIPAYVEYIRQSSAAHVKSVEESRNAWRATAAVLFVLLMLCILYFLWEMFHPYGGLTYMLKEIYSTATPLP